MYTFDAVSNGLINLTRGEMNLVNRTMMFNVAPLPELFLPSAHLTLSATRTKPRELA